MLLKYEQIILIIGLTMIALGSMYFFRLESKEIVIGIITGFFTLARGVWRSSEGKKDSEQ